MNANETYSNILSIRFLSGEHVRKPPDPSSFVQEETIKVTPSRTTDDDGGSGGEDSMDSLSVADVMRQFWVDPNAILSSDGVLRTPEGSEYEDASSGSSDYLSLEGSSSSASDEETATTTPSQSVARSRVSDDPSRSDENAKQKFENMYAT